ncbi:MAG: alpha/beta hydrolase [Solirubrobacteraceae bacterium]
MARARTVHPVMPAELAEHDGLAYSLWLPDRPARAGVAILHGAGSCKESHYDFARALIATGLAAIAFDARGHGASPGLMDARAVQDVVSIAAVLRERIGNSTTPVALRGSSMGAFLALLAASPARACAVVAICPAPAESLRRALKAGRLDFSANRASLEDFLTRAQLESAVESLGCPILLLHAEGDEQVPVAHSRELSSHLRAQGSRLIVVPGGHHRSIQHDPDLQAVSLRFLQRCCSVSRPSST